jgi:NADH-quinone oxidoreductase subunit G
VNGWFICDRGRFSNREVNDPERPRRVLVDGKEAGFAEALDALVLRIGEMEDAYGAGSIAIVGSSRLPMEATALLPLLAGCTASGALCFFIEEDEAAATKAALSVLDATPTASMADVGQSDCIVIYESDLREEGPMLLLAARQAWKRGAPVFLVGKASPLEQTTEIGIEAITLGFIEEVPFAIFEKPAIICGTNNCSVRGIESLAGAGAKPAFLFNGPNSHGAAIMAREHGAVSLSSAINAGKVKGVISVEADIPEELLKDLPFVAALDWRNTPAVKAAQILFPTTAWVEMDGTCINFEGRAQRFRKVIKPGLPLKGEGSASHPPHIHRTVPPGGDVRPAWRIVADIIEGLGGERTVEPLSGKWEPLRELDAEKEGILIHEP